MSVVDGVPGVYIVPFILVHIMLLANHMLFEHPCIFTYAVPLLIVSVTQFQRQSLYQTELLEHQLHTYSIHTR
jgi:hypothetical protein